MASIFTNLKAPNFSELVTSTTSLGKAEVNRVAASVIADLKRATGLSNINTDRTYEQAKTTVFNAYKSKRDQLIGAVAENEVYIDELPDTLESGVTEEELAAMDAELAVLNTKKTKLNALQEACIALRVNTICQGCASLNGDSTFADALQDEINLLGNNISFITNLFGAITDGSSDLIRQLAICALNLSQSVLAKLTSKVFKYAKTGGVDMVEALHHVVVGGGGRINPDSFLPTLMNKMEDSADNMTTLMSIASAAGYDSTQLYQTTIPNTAITAVNLDRVKVVAKSASGGLSTLMGSAESKITSSIVGHLFT